ncbi:MAG: ABC transporter substrate-binding protein, partial [Hyphomicrobiales bacterium]|nr:ABC transporter substrate-binding protein [Hyphomicrobiales bacterium]
MQRILGLFVLAGALALSFAVQAQEKLKIGIVLSLSGPPAALGKQALDGFQLGLKSLGGKLGGREVETVVVDDELKPDL